VKVKKKSKILYLVGNIYLALFKPVTFPVKTGKIKEVQIYSYPAVESDPLL
jgi:hypothetical protein